MVKYGERGIKVTEVQKLLSMLGYDLVMDGRFDNRTTRSLQAFQKKMGLAPDGLVGSKILEALKAAQKRSAREEKSAGKSKDYGSLNVNKDFQLNTMQYIKQITKKDKVFIHFTEGDKSAYNAIKSWTNESAISVAYVIDGEQGQIHECFNPDFWSFHLGIKGTNGSLDKTSIGIEICTFGQLTKKGDKYYNLFKAEVPENEVCELEKSFRGSSYYHRYSDAQLESIEKLLEFLIVEYGIQIQNGFDMDWFDFKPECIKNKNPGIWTHVNVRKDKSDSYPDQRLLNILNRLSKKYNS